jgi:hypothetical protein
MACWAQLLCANFLWESRVRYTRTLIGVAPSLSRLKYVIFGTLNIDTVLWQMQVSASATVEHSHAFIGIYWGCSAFGSVSRYIWLFEMARSQSRAGQYLYGQVFPAHIWPVLRKQCLLLDWNLPCFMGKTYSWLNFVLGGYWIISYSNYIWKHGSVVDTMTRLLSSFHQNVRTDSGAHLAWYSMCTCGKLAEAWNW